MLLIQFLCWFIFLRRTPEHISTFKRKGIDRVFFEDFLIETEYRSKI
jgi:hypothetical protein